MDDRLRNTLSKIKTLADKNPEFANELRKIVKVPSPAVSASHVGDKIDKIEKYLALDYSIDSYIPDIGYSQIKEINVRNQLISDYREMMRFRYGVRSHKIDFGEFCRYAHLQIEMLINRFIINKYNNDFAAFKKDYEKISKEQYKIKANITKIEEVPLMRKYYLIKEQYKIGWEHYNNIEFISWVRNAINHRAPINSTDIRDRHEDYFNILNKSGLPLNSNKDGFDTNKFCKDTIKRNIYNTQYKENEEFKKLSKAYRFEKWKYNENYDDVISELAFCCENLL